MGELPGTALVRNHPSVNPNSPLLGPSPAAAAGTGGRNRALVGAAVGLAALSICCCLIVVTWHAWLAARADINPLSWGAFAICYFRPGCWRPIWRCT
jgi:hypothetical protein